jgi:SAM-dependent methyltransferase
MDDARMRQFWDERAKEDALFFVDNRMTYRDPDVERFWREGESGLRDALAEMEVSIRPSDVVLDIGCGVGRLTRPLAAQAARVVALDVSEEMLTRARELNTELDNVEWRLGDGTTLAGIGDASIDACVSIVVFQHIPDARITLGYVREIGRVLKDGGWAAIQFSNDPEIHRPRRLPLKARVRALLGRSPGGQDHPAWLGSCVELADLEGAAAEGGLAVERTWDEGSLFCRMRLRKGAAP